MSPYDRRMLDNALIEARWANRAENDEKLREALNRALGILNEKTPERPGVEQETAKGGPRQ